MQTEETKMYFLEKVIINGFWGNETLEVSLKPDVNFFIGINGSGKTTAINLIAAALNADFQTLDRIQFKKIDLQLAVKGKAIKPSIQILKTQRKNSPFGHITYKIKEKATGQIITYSLEDLEEQMALRGFTSYRALLQRSTSNILEKLKSLVNVSWLSIHRSESNRMIREERSFESSVDKKIDELNNEFVKYFSLLVKQGAIETNKFQEKVFLSLIPQQSEQAIFTAVENLKLNEEKSALVDIFNRFQVSENTYTSNLNKHFKALNTAQRKLSSAESIYIEDMVAIISALRTHSVVQDWNKLIEDQNKIFEPRDTFLETVNGMFAGKNFEINEKNELIAVTDNKKKVNLTQLSSGEKQLIIILGEALLQQKKQWIYIADEPELSLHVIWQEQLVRNLQKINPNSQIIFATHSPDIVSNYDKNIFKMEDVLK